MVHRFKNRCNSKMSPYKFRSYEYDLYYLATVMPNKTTKRVPIHQNSPFLYRSSVPTKKPFQIPPTISFRYFACPCIPQGAHDDSDKILSYNVFLCYYDSNTISHVARNWKHIFLRYHAFILFHSFPTTFYIP